MVADDDDGAILDGIPGWILRKEYRDDDASPVTPPRPRSMLSLAPRDQRQIVRKLRLRSPRALVRQNWIQYYKRLQWFIVESAYLPIAELERQFKLQFKKT